MHACGNLAADKRVLQRCVLDVRSAYQQAAMSDRLLPFVVLAVLASILAGGVITFQAPKATAITAADSTKANRLPIPAEVARAAAPSKPATTIVSARPPVPLLLSRHAAFWVDDSQPPKTMEGNVIATEDKTGLSAAAAKAMIEGDGYKSVKTLVHAPDGAWRGLALRGATEVAISVDTTGRVSAQ